MSNKNHIINSESELSKIALRALEEFELSNSFEVDKKIFNFINSKAPPGYAVKLTKEHTRDFIVYYKRIFIESENQNKNKIATLPKYIWDKYISEKMANEILENSRKELSVDILQFINPILAIASLLILILLMISYISVYVPNPS